MADSYCPRIHHGLTLSNVTRTGLDYAVCCWADRSIHGQHIIEWYHPALSDLRQLNQQGMLPADYCAKCINQERAGQQSMRQGYLGTHGPATYDNSLQYLDINIDTTCNLACVTCGPADSTTWSRELKIRHGSVRPKLPDFLGIFDQIDFSSLKEIRFWGGEPFLTKTHVTILEYLADRFTTGNIKLMYNTNGTQLIDDHTKKLIERFKFARISFSIDAVGDRFNYIRYPAKWAEVESNLMWWKKNLPHNSMLSLTTTASIYSVLYLDEVFEWCATNFSHSRFGDPIEIYVHQAFGWSGLEYMTDSMAAALRDMPDYCQSWIQKSDMLAKSSYGSGEFVKQTSVIDKRRNLFLSDVLPEVAALMGYHR